MIKKVLWNTNFRSENGAIHFPKLYRFVGAMGEFEKRHAYLLIMYSSVIFIALVVTLNIKLLNSIIRHGVIYFGCIKVRMYPG